jgi:MmyB-like transcription regulator ligand binding domain/Helix-turn-helix domain
VDYYVRLEQGRDDHPSEQVLDALARALHLDSEATAHLHWLAHPIARHGQAQCREQVPVGIRQLVGSWDTPAFVHDRYLEVVFANRTATALSPIFTAGINLVRAVFLDPAATRLYGTEAIAIEADAVAGLRSAVGPDVDEPRHSALVGELSARSERFRQLWGRHDVRARTGDGFRTMHHPQVGELRLRYEKLTVTGTGQTLVIYHAEPGAPSECALRRLAALA